MHELFPLIIYFLPIIFVVMFSVLKFEENFLRKINIYSFLLPFMVTLYLIFRFVFVNPQPIAADLFQIDFGHHHISISIYIDRLSCVILFLTGYLSVLVARLSQIYLHRERGYQRFYKTINLFVFGLQVLAIAGTLDLFFAGWEIIGFSSFLLIAFYRDRTRPVKNAFRIYSIYRIADFGLLLGAIIGHVLLKNADHFNILLSEETVIQTLENSGWMTILGLMLVFAAIGKSAQFPFLNWPARAMEGPTPSSAIFYGALSIHCGIFLLYRTYPIWSHSQLVVGSVVVIALVTILLASGIERVQSNIKGQLAYASVIQIAFMFIEIALGWHTFVLIHIVCHCLLRCYQLLVSPSVVVEHIKTLNKSDLRLSKKPFGFLVPEKIKNTLYSLASQEAFLSTTERGFTLLPAIRVKLWIRGVVKSVWTPIVLLSSLVIFAWHAGDMDPKHMLAYLYGGIGLILSLACLTSLKQPMSIWKRFGIAQLAFLLSVYFINSESLVGIVMYTVSALPCWLCGFFSLRGIADIDMKIYNGLYVTARNRATFFFIAFIGLSGLPFTTTFWAEDILIAEIITINPPILIMTTISLMLNGLIVARIMIKTFWGFPTYKKY